MGFGRAISGSGERLPPGSQEWHNSGRIRGGLDEDAERDMARFGDLYLRNGRWWDRQIVSQKWIEMARTPSSANPQYGYMNWYLNTERRSLPAAPETSVTFRGAGSN